MEDTYTSLTKCINSESKQYKPVLVDKLILDDVPTVNSLNAITSDAVARAVAGASGEVPAVTENDNGKVLKAVYDAGGPAVEWGEAAPAVTVDQTYNALSKNPQSGTAVAGAIATVKQVPASTSADENKVLTVNAQGAAEWANSPVNVDRTNKIIQFGSNLQASYYDGGSQSVPFDLNMSQNGDYVVMEFSLPQHQNFNPNGVVFNIDSDFTVGSLYTDGQAYDCYSILADNTPATDGSGFMFVDPATGPTSGKACRGTYTISSDATLVTVLTLKIRFNSSYDAASGYTRISNNWSSHVQVQSTYSTYLAQFIPAFSSADAGKVLQVQNDGTLAWVTLS